MSKEAIEAWDRIAPLIHVDANDKAKRKAILIDLGFIRQALQTRNDMVMVPRDDFDLEVESVKAMAEIFKDGWDNNDLIKCQKFHSIIIQAAEENSDA